MATNSTFGARKLLKKSNMSAVKTDHMKKQAKAVEEAEFEFAETTQGYHYIDEGRKHMHSLDGRPLLGTSTVVDIIAKTLHWWSAELAAVECLETGEHIPTIREEYLAIAGLQQPFKSIEMAKLEKKYPIFKKARHAHNEKKKGTAKTGTDMHFELEKYVKNCIEHFGGKPYLVETGPDAHKAVVLFSIHAVDEVEKFLWSEGHCYAREAWVGGISDCGALMKTGKIAIYDFKSAKEAYYGHFVQVGGYALEVEENGIMDAEGKVILKLDQPIGAIYVVPFGSEDPTPRVRYDVEEKKIDFLAAVRLYKANEIN